MITLYSKPACPGCRQTKRFFERNQIAFTERDVTVDADALARVRELGYSQMPVVETAQTSWCGYDPDRLATLPGGAPA